MKAFDRCSMEIEKQVVTGFGEKYHKEGLIRGAYAFPLSHFFRNQQLFFLRKDY
jgi:hypothetical protein